MLLQRIGNSVWKEEEKKPLNPKKPQGRALEMCTPRPRWIPAQRMQMKTPVLMDAQLARPAAPPPEQSAQARLPGSASSARSAAACALFSSIVTPFISPAPLHARHAA